MRYRANQCFEPRKLGANCRGERNAVTLDLVTTPDSGFIPEVHVALYATFIEYVALYAHEPFRKPTIFTAAGGHCLAVSNTLLGLLGDLRGYRPIYHLLHVMSVRVALFRAIF
jgi:hypothetical protein